MVSYTTLVEDLDGLTHLLQNCSQQDPVQQLFGWSSLLGNRPYHQCCRSLWAMISVLPESSHWLFSLRFYRLQLSIVSAIWDHHLTRSPSLAVFSSSSTLSPTSLYRQEWHSLQGCFPQSVLLRQPRVVFGTPQAVQQFLVGPHPPLLYSPQVQSQGTRPHPPQVHEIDSSAGPTPRIAPAWRLSWQ